jgi:hypothetical protein
MVSQQDPHIGASNHPPNALYNVMLPDDKFPSKKDQTTYNDFQNHLKQRPIPIIFSFEEDMNGCCYGEVREDE